MPESKSITLARCPACGGNPHPPISQFRFVDCRDCGFAAPAPLGGLTPEEMWNTIAEALVGDRPWVDAGPTVEEAGGESILVRVGKDLMRGRWNHTLREWLMEGSTVEVLVVRDPPTGWRPMPKADGDAFTVNLTMTSDPRETWEKFRKLTGAPPASARQELSETLDTSGPIQIWASELGIRVADRHGKTVLFSFGTGCVVRPDGRVEVERLETKDAAPPCAAGVFPTLEPSGGPPESAMVVKWPDGKIEHVTPSPKRLAPYDDPEEAEDGAQASPDPPCPFCGSAATQEASANDVDVPLEWHMECASCGARGPSSTLAVARKEWARVSRFAAHVTPSLKP